MPPRTVIKKHRFNRIVKEFLRLYLTSSSIHGLSHIPARKRHPIEKFVWIISVFFGLCGAIFLCYSTWTRYQENPTVISLERNYQEWNTTFAAATLCPSEKIDENYDAKKFNVSIEWMLSLANISYDNIGEMNEDKLPTDQFFNAVLESTFKFDYTLTTSNSESSLLMQTFTESGICYSFNSQLAIYNNPQYLLQGNTTIVKPFNEFKGNPLEGDIYAQVMEINSGYKVYIHSPTEVADAATNSITSKPKYYNFLALSTYSTEATKSLTVQQRKCRFIEESELTISPAYSYKLCRMDCRMKLANKLCNCVPYFYRRTNRLIKLRKGSEKEDCKCLPPCNDVNYSIYSTKLSEWFLGTNFKYGLIKYPRSRLKRDIFFGFEDLLVQFGGTVGLCLGASVLSCFEFLYFFTLRLLLFLIRRFR